MRPLQRRDSCRQQDVVVFGLLASLLLDPRVSASQATSALNQRTRECGLVALVTRVLDGDTIDVSGIGRVRLLGIDAPEIGGRFESPAPFAVEAREALQSLVLHRWVRLECDGTRRDDYGRWLFNVLLETGEFVNASIVRGGLARVSARVRLLRWDDLHRAELDAQSRRRGMWGERPRVPPTSFTLPRPGSHRAH